MHSSPACGAPSTTRQVMSGFGLRPETGAATSRGGTQIGLCGNKRSRGSGDRQMTGSLVSSAHVRRKFLDYFAGNSHTVVPSSPVVPPDDPTLLFANSGMVPFKRTFLGLETRSYTRATSSQKCVRVSGKHNDLDEVGPSTRHNTFFEMLGNFSFGDYSKAEAIDFAFEFLTDVVGLDKDLLWPTIFETDDESSQLWQDITGIPESRITRLGKKDNFWTMGESGPCGPASEIVFDRGPDKCTCRRADCHLRHGDCDRWWEIWNLVFMQFDLSPDGTMTPLRRRSIDTGMGLERLTAVLQGADTVYETDVFVPILEAVRTIVGRTEQDGFEAGAFRAIADHSRATAFIVADGVLPGNEGRGEVVRLLMRRAIRFGRAMGVERPFLGDVVEAVVQAMGGYYTELLAKRDFLSEVVLREEQRFDQTLASGLGMFENLVAEVKASGGRVIPGVDVFRLYDTFGFPHLLSRDVAREHGLEIDEAGFDEAMEAQRARARGAVKAGQSEASLIATGVGCEATQFVGYERLEADARVLVLGAGGRLG